VPLTPMDPQQLLKDGTKQTYLLEVQLLQIHIASFASTKENI
jgi:hypothetical protein